jgi:adenylylsulfate kinase
MQQQGFVLWLTGLSGAGKTTIAQVVEQDLKARQRIVEVLDGDVIRTHLCQGLGFSKVDRDINVRRIGFVAHLLSRNGVIALVSVISPYREIREELRQTIPNFVEVYVDTPLEICEQRDVKGLYAKARAGSIPAFTGIDSPYEVPLNPDIVCPTINHTIAESAMVILESLEKMQYISAKELSFASL